MLIRASRNNFTALSNSFVSEKTKIRRGKRWNQILQSVCIRNRDCGTENIKSNYFSYYLSSWFLALLALHEGGNIFYPFNSDFRAEFLFRSELYRINRTANAMKIANAPYGWVWEITLICSPYHTYNQIKTLDLFLLE